MTRPTPRSHADRLRKRARRQPSGLALPVVIALAVGCLSACARPLPRGEGPTTLAVQAAEISTPTGRMVGRVRIEVADYESSCPRLFDRTLFGMRKAVETVGKNDPPAQIGVIPGHVYQVSLQHRGAGSTADQACESAFWFKPVEGANYSIALHSDLDSCSIRETQPRQSPLTPYPTCAQALASGAPDERASSDDGAGEQQRD